MNRAKSFSDVGVFDRGDRLAFRTHTGVRIHKPPGVAQWLGVVSRALRTPAAMARGLLSLSPRLAGRVMSVRELSQH